MNNLLVIKLLTGLLCLSLFFNVIVFRFHVSNTDPSKLSNAVKTYQKSSIGIVTPKPSLSNQIIERPSITSNKPRKRRPKTGHGM